MLYAILAYHVEDIVQSWSAEEDAALMDELLKLHARLVDEGVLGPAARLGATQKAATLRGPGAGAVVDGPFAETKEALLGFYTLECASRDEALAVARALRRVNPTAVYEVRPIELFLSGAPLTGAPLPGTEPEEAAD
ncbi:YciI family protein [Bosea sp. 117]|uniref:YciI family protein n=1 Tax=Bosea sp. 117 TaxID=1125973 RepID=UPI00068BE65F|nr:YciI family protein [Bosea sp. 117]